MPLGWRIPTLGLIVLAAIALGFIPGCGGGGTPEQTVAGFYEAIYDGNASKARSYCTSSFGEDEVSNPEDFQQQPPGEMGDMGDMGENIFTEENLTGEISGDTARVWLKDSDILVFVLVKQGGRWKIDDMDVNIPDFTEMMEGMPEGFEMPEGIEMPGG